MEDFERLHQTFIAWVVKAGTGHYLNMRLKRVAGNQNLRSGQCILQSTILKVCVNFASFLAACPEDWRTQQFSDLLLSLCEYGIS